MTTAIDESIPEFGLSPHAGRGPVQNTGCGEALIVLRSSLILTNSAVYHPGATDAINIRNVARISIWISFVIGALTNVIIRPYFMLTKTHATEYHMPMPLYTVAERVIDVAKAGHLETEYTLTATANVIIPLINPGAEWFRLSVQGTFGGAAGSLLYLAYTRSYLPHHISDGVPAA